MVASIVSSYTVKPARETPGGIMCLSECDQVKAITHAPTIYFYRLGGGHGEGVSLESATEILRNSLSEVLVNYYPFAGRLRLIGGARLEIDCNAEGALLIAVESEAKIDDFGDFEPSPEIRALIPSVDYSEPIHDLPLMLVQVTKFSCGGLSLGLGLSHIIVDGRSALDFVSEWAEIARCGVAGQSSEPPFLDRSILGPPEHLTAPLFDYPQYKPQPLLIGKKDSLEERKRETASLLLKLSKEQIEKIKEKANEETAVSNGGSRHRPYSRFEAVAGHVWRTACKAREHEPDQPTNLLMALDARNRMQPPLPARYFGNAVFRLAVESTAGELFSKGLGYACGKVREKVEKANHEYIESCLLFLKNQEDVINFRNFHTVGCSKGAFFGNPNIEITSWVNLPLYGTDFGWGPEIYMGPGAVGYDGKVFLLPGKDQDGSFLLALRLQVRHIKAFQKFFYQDI